MPVLHADQLRLSRMIGFNCREAGESTLLTDASVAAADTVAGLKTAVDNANVHADQVPFKPRVKGAIQYGAESAEITDALVLGLTTVTGLVNLTDAVNHPANRELFE